MKALLNQVKSYIKEFVRVTSNAIVLFYQLDIISGEITEVCLYNLLSSLVLKNPIYSRLIELFRQAHRDMLTLIEQQIEKLQGRRQEVAKWLGISEIDIGKHILQQSKID